MASHQQCKLPSAFLPFIWLSRGAQGKHPKPFWLMCCEISSPCSRHLPLKSYLPHHWLSKSLDTETCKNKYPGDSSCDPFITGCCCRAQLRKAGQRKSTCCKGTSRANPGVLGRSTLLCSTAPALFLQLPVSKRQLDQAWMFKYCHEGSSLLGGKK